MHNDIKKVIESINNEVESESNKLVKDIERLVRTLEEMKEELENKTELQGNSAARFQQNASYILTNYTMIQVKQQTVKSMFKKLRHIN